VNNADRSPAPGPRGQPARIVPAQSRLESGARAYDSARFEAAPSRGHDSFRPPQPGNPEDRGTESGRTLADPGDAGADSSPDFGGAYGGRAPADSSASRERLDRVYRSDAPIDFAGWAPLRARVPVLAGSSLERGNGPASSRLRGGSPRSPAFVVADADADAQGRMRLGGEIQRANSESITRESLLERYRRAGTSAISRAADVNPRERVAGGAVELSRGRGVLRPKSTGPADRAANDRSGSHVLASGERGHSQTESARELQKGGSSRLSVLNKTHPDGVQRVLRQGEAIASATSVSVQVALSAGCGVLVSPSCCGWWGMGNSCWGKYPNGCWPGAWWWGGNCLWWSCWYPSWGFCYWFNSCGYWSCGSPYYCEPYAYYSCPPPVYYSTVIYESAEPVADSPAEEPAPYVSEAAVGEGSLYVDPPPVSSSLPVPSSTAADSKSRLTSEFLTLGDSAFRAGRYSDAVYAYARAVEVMPEDAVLHLILSDALFATGDYHYCAYALRRALELDPSLVDSVVDKHNFYGDPSEFDRQISLLERYLQDHFVDDDARLVLAANYLFANRPAQASDLLESAFSLTVRDSAAGQVILKRAQALR
jgi:hypothetical protein